MESGRFLQVPEQNGETDMDKYTASIELSNACRQFYKSRVEAADCFKSRWERHTPHPPSPRRSSSSNNNNDNDKPADDSHSGYIPTRRKGQKNSIDEAMDKLRSEMTSLMDQDLSLMKQLLTLNETIEELKSQRRYYYSRCSLHASSADFHRSDVSVSDTEMYATDSDDDTLVNTAAATTTTTTTTPGLSKSPVMVLTPPSSCSSSSTLNRKYGVVHASGHVTTPRSIEQRCTDSLAGESTSSSSSVKVFHSGQDSFDSGIHDPSIEEVTVV